MKRKLSWFDRLMSAITFAEANDHETARKLLKSNKPNQKPEEQHVLEPVASEI